MKQYGSASTAQIECLNDLNIYIHLSRSVTVYLLILHTTSDRFIFDASTSIFYTLKIKNTPLK